MKYVFRLSSEVKKKLDLVAPPRKHGRSELIRQALVSFLCKPKQPLADRPHVRGRDNAYKQVCAILEPAQIDAIKAVYPDMSVSVVIQAAVSSELRKARYKIVDLPDGNSITTTPPPDAKDEDTNDYPDTRGITRELAAVVD